ncbi:M56 family metallopeptidase [Actinocorallia populi]|uniref:M56 family metallopeptidase n=1 Tax=Actinocorallia populi TaxID=2079200 RepID=UPI000D08F324|nr:M56 family metallopeptidase [Actinocorallia populi]
MNWFTFLPALITFLLSMVLGRVPLPLHPLWSARVLGTVAATTVLATIGTFFFIAVNYGASLLPRVADRLPEWALFGDDHPVPAWLGLPAIALTVTGTVTVSRLAARWATEVRSAQELSRGLLETDIPVAVAVPGRRGGVLASKGLIRALTTAELQVVFEHEASHLRHRHHRYLAVGSLAAGTLPPLRRLNERLRFCLERWADEDAAESVGDRGFVARTIAKVALLRSPSPPGALPAFADSGVVQRVQALLGAAPGRNPVSGPATLLTTGLTTGALALVALQLDHALNLSFL